MTTKTGLLLKAAGVAALVLAGMAPENVKPSELVKALYLIASMPE